MSLALVSLSCFSLVLSIRADTPVITTSPDLRILNINEKFDPFAASPSWVEQAPMPTARFGFSTAVVNGIIYAIGGTQIAQDQCSVTEVVEAYDPGTDTWNPTPLPTPPTKRYRAAAAALDGFIYLVGGEDRSMPNVCGDVVNTVERYDPVSNTWLTEHPLMFARSQISLAVDQDNHMLYAVGGSAGSSGNFVADRIVEVYDPTQDTWSLVMNMTTPRALPSVGVINGKIYALGGQDANTARIASDEDYDILGSQQWTLLPSTMPFPCLNPSAAVIEGRIYVVGGVGGGTILAPQPTVQVYDPLGPDSWATSSGDPSLPPMPGGRGSLGAAMVYDIPSGDDILYAIGGDSPNATVNQPWAYQITAVNNPDSFSVSNNLSKTGLSLVNPTLGIIAGIPTLDVAEAPVKVSATNSDGTGPPETINFYILKDPMLPPGTLSIAGGNCVTARADVPFSFQVVANNASSNAIFQASGLPYTEGFHPQLTMDPATGLITGTVTPTSDYTPQSFGITLAVSDLAGTVTAQSFLQLTFITEPTNTVPIIDSPASVTLPLNKSFSYTITADAPADTFDFIDAAGNLGSLDGMLPAGLKFDQPSHTISGIYIGDPTAEPAQGTFAATIPTRETSLRGNPPPTIKKPPPKIQNCANMQSSGTETGIGPLVFIPSLRDYEIETLPTDTGGTEYHVFTDDPLASGTGAGLLYATQVNQFVTYTVPVTVPGTYDVNIGIKTNKGKGEFQLYIDGLAQGATVDEYSPSAGRRGVDLGAHKFEAVENSSFNFQVVTQNQMSMGYQLVFDYIDLVPRGEAEALVFTNSKPVVPVQDAMFSGGMGEMLKARRGGDYVTFTMPVPVPGYYDIKVATRTGTANGIFQVAVNGVKLGYTQDEYATTTAYGTPNVGTIYLDQDAQITFTVAGRNPMSTGYALVFDYIDLVLSSQLEAENLVYTGTAPISKIIDPVLSAGEGTLLKATSASDSITYTVHIPVGGTYDIKVGNRTGKKSGKFQLSIDNNAQGTEQDQYSAKIAYQVFDLGTMNFPGSGDSSFKFSVTGQNPNSTGYQLLFDYIELVRYQGL